MSPEDLEIWRRWYPGVSLGVKALYFDVGVGLADDLPASEDSSQLLGWIANTQKRIDVLIERETVVDVVELRFNASANAFGRVLVYRELLGQDNPFDKPLRAFLVTNKKDSELARLAEQNGVVWVVA
jgi:hypothetical protein